MYVRFSYGMPTYLDVGETTNIYLDIVNDADYKVRFYEDFYYSTDKGATWSKFAHHEDAMDAGKSYTNLKTLVKFTMPNASEAILHLSWTARKINPDGTIGEVVASGDHYHTIKRSGGGVDIESALMQELKKWYKKNVTVPGVTESYDWSFDRTDKVVESGLIENVEKAYLYGRYEIRSYSYAGKERPPKRSARDIVSDWLNGIELALLNIGTDVYSIPEEYAGYYWVTVPCKLVVVQKEALKLEIVKNVASTYFTINGENVGPGEYPTQKGSYARFKITVKNPGGASDYWVAVYDIKAGQYVWYEEGYIGAGETKSHTGSIRVDRDMELMVAVGRGDLVGENTEDTWGC